MDKQLRRILDLVRKTGDRMVVTDSNGEDVYVVMGLEQYEDLIDAPCDCDDSDQDYGMPNGNTGVDNSIDQDSSSGFGEVDETTESVIPSGSERTVPPSDIWDAMQPAGNAGETWNIGTMSEVEKADLERQFEAYQKTKREEAKSDVPESSENVGSDDDLGEEQFYLEPVE